MSFPKNVLKKMIIITAPVATFYLGLKRSEEHLHRHLELTAKSADPKSPEVLLYTLPPSLWTGKVLGYLDYHGIPYNNVRVNVFTKEQLLFSKDYKLMPIAMVNGHQVNDSAAIVEAVAKKYSRYDQAAMKILDEEVGPALSATIYENWDNIRQFSSDKPLLYKVMFTVLRPIFSYRQRSKYGEVFDSEKLLPALNKAFTSIGNNSSPTAAELALFGMLRTTKPCDTVNDAITACGRTAWFDKIAAECQAKSKATLA